MTAPQRSQPHWDPRQYLQHAGPRARPLRDLLARVPDPSGVAAPRIADLGCGPGGPTALLADRWPQGHITGYDSSPDMLASAQQYAGPTAGGGRIDFAEADLAAWLPGEAFDVIISNAALHWVPGHSTSFPVWVKALRPSGVLAFQVPGNFASASHVLLTELCESPQWRPRLSRHGRHTAPVLEPAQYLEHLTALGCEVDAWETTYVHLLTGPDPVLEWVKGTTLRPVLTELADDPEAHDAFLAQYGQALRAVYPEGPYGTVYPFRRIFVAARKPD